MRKILSTTAIASLAATLAIAAASAQALSTGDSRSTARAGWKSVAEIVAKVEGQGYRVLEVEADDGAYEVKAVDTNGMRIEAHLDPSTGEPVRGWRQDD